MVEIIGYPKFQSHPPSDKLEKIFLKIYFGQKVINKKCHFLDKIGLKTQVSHVFSPKFLWHWLVYYDIWNLGKNQYHFQKIYLIKFWKYETGFFSKWELSAEKYGPILTMLI